MKIFYRKSSNKTSIAMSIVLLFSATVYAQKVLVKDINQKINNYGSSPQELTEFKGELYFIAESFRYGRELWKTDGTVAGTQIVKDIMKGDGGAFRDAENLTVMNGAL